uniref:Uncharacterized protein n=1 Tax=Ananas comosus var. bracteatus TaxID=296719 RepID=A0A6V7PHC5_ANACO|nr:unnamed protein product [Ananas comosus var. bracteatus]
MLRRFERTTRVCSVVVVDHMTIGAFLLAHTMRNSIPNLRIVNSTVLEQWVECDRFPSHWTNFEDELLTDSRPRVECGRSLTTGVRSSGRPVGEDVCALKAEV